MKFCIVLECYCENTTKSFLNNPPSDAMINIMTIIAVRILPAVESSRKKRQVASSIFHHNSPTARDGAAHLKTAPLFQCIIQFKSPFQSINSPTARLQLGAPRPIPSPLYPRRLATARLQSPPIDNNNLLINIWLGKPRQRVDSGWSPRRHRRWRIVSRGGAEWFGGNRRKR